MISKKSMAKIGAIGIVAIVAIAALFVLVLPLFSSAIMDKKEYLLGEEIKLNMENLGDYKLKIITPSTSLVRVGTNDFFIFKPQETGNYTVQLWRGLGKKEYYFEVFENETKEGSSETLFRNYGPGWSDSCSNGLCVRSVHSGSPNIKNSNGEYKPFTEVVNFTKEKEKNLEVSWNGKNINLEAEAIISGKRKEIPPSMNFNTIIKKGLGEYKWAHEFDSIFGLQAIVLKVNSSMNISVIDRDTLLIDEVVIDFSDLYNRTCLREQDAVSEETFCDESGIIVQSRKISEKEVEIEIRNFTGRHVVLDPTVTSQYQTPDSDNLNDAYIYSRSGYTNLNYGASTDLNVRSRTDRIQRSYIMFNISALPSDATIYDAQLCLFLYSDGGTNGITALHVRAYNWSEGELDGGDATGQGYHTNITWANQPCGTTLSGTSCNRTMEDYKTTNPGNNNWVCWNITKAVQRDFAAGYENVSIVLNSTENTGSSDGADTFYSKEHDTAGERPYLNITYNYNAAPNHTTPKINSTFGTNGTDENITVYNQSTTDLDGTAVRNIINWYLDGRSILVLNLPFEGGSNSSWTKDYSGYGHNATQGTSANQPTWNSTGGYDRKGAYEFATNDYFNISATEALKLRNANFTVFAWTYVTGTTQQMFVYHGYGCSTWSSYLLSIGGNENEPQSGKYAFGFGTSNAATNNNVYSTGNALTNRWVFLTATYDGATLSLYVNGVLNNTASASGIPWNSLESLYIGADPGCGLRDPVNGKIDEVRIYNRSLSAVQIKELYNNRTDLIVAEETSIGDKWSACITPNDGVLEGPQLCSSNLTVLFIDSSPPTGTLITPLPGAIVDELPVNLTVNTTDNYQLRNATLFIYNSSGSLINQTTRNISGTSFLLGIEYNFPYYGLFNWSYLIADNFSLQYHTNNNSINYSSGAPLSVTINFPANTTYNDNHFPLNFEIVLNKRGSSVKYEINDDGNVSMSSTNNLTYNATNSSMIDGAYRFMVYANASAGNTNYTTYVDFYVDVNMTPTHSTPVLSATTILNSTSDNLTVYNQSTYDADGDYVKNIINWYMNNVSLTLLNLPFEGSSNSSWTKDYSGYGHNATQATSANQPTYNRTAGYDRKGAYQFATNDYLTISATEALKLRTANFTVSAWTYVTGTTQQMFVYHGLGCSTWANYLLSIGGNEGDPQPGKYAFGFGTANAATNNNVYSTGNALTNRWVFLTATYNGTTLSLYVNGVLNNTASASGTPWNSAENLYIGADPGCGLRDPLNGRIDEVMIYNRSLTAVQIKELYNNRTDLIVAEETSIGQIWRACISPNDGILEGIRLCSNNLTISVQDSTAPNATLLAPENGTTNTTAAQNFTVNVTDNVGLLNTTLYIYNQTALVFNETRILNGVTTSIVGIVYTFLYDGIFNWFYKVFDLSNQFYTTGNWTIHMEVVPPAVTIVSPVNGLTINDVTPLLNVSVIDASGIDSVWYTTNQGEYNITLCRNCTNKTAFLYVQEGDDSVIVYSNDSYGNTNFSSSLFVVDMNHTYYDSFDDNSSVQTSNSVSLNNGNISFTGSGAIANITIDNTDASCTLVGTWTASTSVAGYYGTNYHHDGNAAADPDESAVYTPTITSSGNYRVYIRWTSGANRPDAAPVTVKHSSGVDTSVTINQQSNGGVWNYVGTWNFATGTSGWVAINASDSGNTIADAVIFEYVPGGTIGNFTSYPINTTETITQIDNITWQESNTNTRNNLSVEVSINGGSDWFSISKGQSLGNIDSGASLVYRVFFATNESRTISLLDMNISWSNSTNPSPNITINSPLNATTVADVTPTLNISLQGNANTLWYNVDGGENITLCTSCTGEQTTFLYLEEGSYTVKVYANNTLDEKSSNTTSFTVDMNYNYFDSFEDNSSITYPGYVLNNVVWAPGNITLYSSQTSKTLLYETFANANDWTLTGGTWSISSGRLTQTENVIDTTAVHKTFNLSSGRNYNLSMEAYDDDNDYTGFIFRYKDSNDYYRCYFRDEDNFGAIQRLDSGTPTNLATTTTTYVENTWNNYSLTIIDDNITCWLNGNPVMSAIDSTWEDGQVGIYNGYHQAALYEDFLVQEFLSINGNFTAYSINTTQPVAQIINITWQESGTNTNNNLTVEISPNNGQNWYDALNGGQLVDIVAGNSPVYRVFFNSNGSRNISLMDMNITWSNEASLPPNISINSPLNTFADVSPSLNVTLQGTANTLWYNVDGGENITLCTSCTGEQTTFLYLEEGSYTVKVYANNTLDEKSYNTTSFTVDMNYNYFDSFEDNSSIAYPGYVLNNVVWAPGKITLYSSQTSQTLFYETFANADDWTLTGGTWSISSGRLTQTGNVIDTTAVHKTFNLSSGRNYNLSMEAYDDDNDYNGFVFRYKDSDDYYRCYFYDEGNTAALQRLDSGTPTNLATTTTTYVENTWNNYSLTIIDDNITCWLNGNPIMSAIDSTWEDGQVGIYNGYHAAALYEDFLVEEFLPLNGNFTGYSINTTSTIVEIENITWEEDETDTNNNISIEVSANNGQDWLSATNGKGIFDMITGSSLVYRVFFNSNGSRNISLMDINITWTDSVSPPPSITINYPANSSIVADVSPTLNVTLDGIATTLWYTINGGFTNTTICTSCTGEQTTFIYLEEGDYTVKVYASNPIGTTSTNTTSFTVDMNYNYFDSFEDNSSLVLINNLTWAYGNITLYSGETVDTLLYETFANANDWTLTGGTWSISSGRLTQTANAEATTAVHKTFNLSSGRNYNLSMEAYDDDNDYTGFIFRYKDSNDYYRCYFRDEDNSGVIQRLDSGTPTNLATTTTTYFENTWNNYSLTIIDDNITCWLNGNPIMSAIDSTWEDGQVGIYNSYHEAALYEDFLVQSISSVTNANFTAYSINTTSTIVEIVNISWQEAGTNTNNNITVELSLNNGLNWYNAVNGIGISEMIPGDSLVYRVFFNSNGSSNISLMDMNITWSDSAAPPPNIMINSPLNGSTIADVSPTLNVTLDGTATTLWYTKNSGLTNTTLCTSCTGEHSTFLFLTEGDYNVTVYASNSLGTTSSNLTSFTINMNQNYYDSFEDNSSLTYPGYVLNGVNWSYGNVSFVGTVASIANITIDNTDASCTLVGTWTASTSVAGYYGTNYHHDGNAGADPDESAVYTPTIASPGNYRVYIRWTSGSNRPDAAPVTVKHSSGVDTSVTINQQANGGVWNYVGTWNFATGTSGWVAINATDSGNTIADAVIFEYTGGSSTGNFTSYSINTTQPIKQISNITWQEAGTDHINNNISVMISSDNGQNWYNATNGGSVSGFSENNSLVYRVSFISNDTRIITLLDMNITWTEPPIVNIVYPLSSTYSYNIQELNYTISTSPGVTLDTCWWRNDTDPAKNYITCGENISGMNSSEGNNTWWVYANDTEGASGYDSVTFNVDLSSPQLAFINQTDEEQIIVNSTNELEQGENLTINVNASDSNLDSVWVVVWETAKGGAEKIRKTFTYVAGILWTVIIPTDSSWESVNYLYTIYANDSGGYTNDYDGSFPMVHLNISIDLSPNPSSGVGEVAVFGKINFTNSTDFANRPINIWLGNSLLLLENLTADGDYNNYQNFTDTESSDFNKGTFYQTGTDGENITLSGTNTTGNFTKILDAGARVEWGTIEWDYQGEGCSGILTWQQEDSNGYYGTKDSYLDSQFSNTNYGESESLLMDTDPYTYRSLIKFDDVLGDGGNKIPYNSTIYEANVTVEDYDAGNQINVFQVLENWEEAQASYNYRVTGTAWSSSGCGAYPSRSATSESSFTPSSTGTYVFDITNAFKKWTNNSYPNYGVVLHPTATNDVMIRSSEYETQAQRPKLTVKFDSTDCTGVVVYVRTSNDKITWSSWQQVNNNGTINDPNVASRYLEYTAVLSSLNSSSTPYLKYIKTNYTAVVTNSTGGYNYNFTSPMSFGTYLVSVNTSYKTITTGISKILSVQAGVSPVVELIFPADGEWFSEGNLTLLYNASDGNNDFSNTTLFINGQLNQTNSSTILNGEYNNFTINFTSGIYNWTVEARDSANNLGSTINRTFYIDLLEPNVTLISPGNDTSYNLNEINLSFNATDDMDSLLSCYATLDGEVINSSISASNGDLINLSSGLLLGGSHYWNITCQDNVGRNFTSLTWEFSITDTPPQVILEWPGENYLDSDGNISFVFNASDNSGFTNCTLIINGTLEIVNQTEINNSGNTVINVTGLGEGNYNWTVECFDLSGSSDKPEERNFSVDLYYPSIQLNLPENEEVLNYSDVYFNFTANDTIDSILSCNFIMNSQILSEGFPAQSGQVTDIYAENLTDGIKYWNVTCEDDAGHLNSSSTWSVNISEPPLVLLNTFNETWFNSPSALLKYIPSDNTNLSSCVLFINGIENRTNSTAILNSEENSFEIEQIADGTYSWRVNCTDYAGLGIESETRVFYVDTNAPNITLFFPDGEDIYAANISFNFTVIDLVDTNLTCNLTIGDEVMAKNFDALNGTVTNLTISGITDGYHEWNVTCWDDSFNINTSVTYNFTRYTIPLISLVWPEDGHWFNTSGFNLTYFPEDDQGFLATYLIIDGQVNMTNATAILNGEDNNFSIDYFPDGHYNWTVNVTDKTGLNNTDTQRTFYVDTHAPLLTLNYPNQSELITTNNVTFNFTIIDNLDENISCDVYLDGENEYSRNVSNGTDSITYLLVPDGNHTWNVTCVDEARNLNESFDINFTVKAPPNVTLDAPEDGNITANDTLRFFYTPIDPIDIVKCDLWGDFNGTWHLNQTDDSIAKNQQNNFTVFGVLEGYRNWTVNCTDPDDNSFQPDARTFTLDKTSPDTNLMLPLNNSGIDFNEGNITFVWNATDILDSQLRCDLRIDGVKQGATKDVTSGTPYSEDIDTLTEGGHSWNVTCWDRAGNTNTSKTWIFNFTYPDFFINLTYFIFNTTTPAEDDLVFINATIRNLGGADVDSFVVRFYDGDPDAGGTQINGDKILSILKYNTTETNVVWTADTGNSNIYVVIDPPIASGGLLDEWNESNNEVNKSVTVGAWFVLYGNVTSESVYVLDDETNRVIKWSANDSYNGTIFIADEESIVSWADIQAVGKNKTGGNTNNDFTDIDTLLGMSSFTDSVYNIFTDSGTIRDKDAFLIFQKNVIDAPIANSTNNTNFMTGILWDSLDDDDGQYSQADEEDLVFASKINKGAVGAYGTYDYEVRVPAALREYKGVDSEVAIYIELY